MPSTEVIYLSRKDTTDTVRELLQLATPGAQVWLVAPWRLRLARELLSLKLLRRTADGAALDLRLVSRHSHTRALAREAGVAAYRAVPFRLRQYRRSRRRGDVGLAARVVPVGGGLGRRWQRRRRTIGLSTVLLSLLVIVGLVGVLAGTSLAFVPRATVTLEPAAKPVSGTFDVTADLTYLGIDYGRAIIPARRVQVIVQGRNEIPTSKSIPVPDAHASGQVVVSNRTSNPVTVPKGTIVRTSSGVNVRFATMADIELPPVLFGNSWVGVIALEPGPSGNVGALTISIVEGEVASLVSVLNPKPTQGGSDKYVHVVSLEDQNRLIAESEDLLKEQAFAEIVSELEGEESVASGSVEVEVMSQHFDQVLDQQSDFVSMDMKIVARGVAVNDQDLESFATQFLESQAGEGMALIEDSLILQRSKDVLVNGILVRMKVSARGMVAPLVDVDLIKRAVRGKERAEAMKWLSSHTELRQEPQITLFPEWWQYLPWLPGQTEIVISAGEA